MIKGITQMDKNQDPYKTLAQYIDHTLLKPEATNEEISKLCTEAKEYQFASVCIPSSYIEKAQTIFKNTSIAIGTVIGFPLGNVSTECKVFEVQQAKKKGATEFDMVIHIGALKAGELEYLYSDIKEVVKAASPYLVKVIFETSLLTPTEIVTATKISIRARAHYIKTSTGFSHEGANKDKVALMLEAANDKIKVKASGGIKDRAKALEFINMGVQRIGTSSGIKIIQSS